MNFMEIVEFLTEGYNKHELEDNAFYSIETAMGYDHNKYIITFKEKTLTYNGKLIDTIVVKDNDRIVEIHCTDKTIQKLDTKDLMSVRSDFIKRAILQAISLANKGFERNKK